MPKTRAETLQTCLERMPTPIGVMLVVTDEEGVVRALDWAEFEERMHRLLRLHYGKGKVTVTERRAPAPVRQALTAYYDGVLDALDALEVVTGGTLFQRNVWAALRTIPIGSTMS